jgi:threonine dehydratase
MEVNVTPTVYPTIDDVYAAQSRLASVIRRTPLIPSERLGAIWGGEVYLKLENLQLTGTFKARGALNKILTLS